MAEKGKSPRKGGKRGADKEIVAAPELGGQDVSALVKKMMSDPNAMGAIQDKLQGLIGKSSGYLEGLPEPVRRRIRALKNNQVAIIKIEEEFHREVCRLQAVFEEKFQDLFALRKTIVTGDYEPTDEECEWEEDEDDDEEEGKGDAEKKDEGQSKEEKPSDEDTVKDEGTNVDGEDVKEGATKPKPKEVPAVDAKGIPQFWMTAFRNAEIFDPLIQEWDVPVLENLEDIRVLYPSANGLDFVLEFHFKDNEYLNQKVLTKTYNLKCELDDENPFDFDGPEIISSEGCKISWKENKNVTVKTVKKTQKHKNKGQTRVVTKTVKQDSFFNFFEGFLEEDNEDDEEVDEEGLDAKELDFARGEFVRDSFVSKAVLFFTGEIQDDEESGDEEDYLNDEDYDEEGDPDFDPSKLQIGQGGKPNECQNQ